MTHLKLIIDNENKKSEIFFNKLNSGVYPPRDQTTFTLLLFSNK